MAACPGNPDPSTPAPAVTDTEQACVAGPVCVFGASTIGPLHVKAAMPCQDAFAYEVLPAGWCVIAVADGLGSAARSDLGARTAVEAAVRAVARRAAAEPALAQLAREGASAARAELEKTASATPCPLRDLACTLLITVLQGDRAAAAQVGDGAIVAKTAAGLRLLSAPGDSEYANEVMPLTSRDWVHFLRVSPVVDGVQGILAFTDGCQRAALRKTGAGYTAFEGFCQPLFAFAAAATDPAAANQDLENLLRSSKLAEHSEDDKTLVLAVVHPPGGNKRP